MPIMKGHEDYLELAASYAIDSLDSEDRVRFEGHLATGCDVCRKALLDAQRVASDLALLAPQVAPPDSVRSALFEKVRSGDPGRAASRRRTPTVLLSWLAAAATLAAIGLALHARGLQDRVDTEARRRERVEGQLEALRETMNAFTAPGTRAVSLEGQAGAEGAAARAFVDPVNRRLFLYVYNLPPPPSGRTYQLWLIVGGAPVSMGTFGVEPDGSGRLDTTSVPSFEGEVTVAVSVEPEGGVPQPTGPIVLVGS